MTRLLRIVAVMLLFVSGSAAAHCYEIGGLQIIHPWARATVPSAQNGVVYVAISNEGDTADRLVAVASPAAARAELHTILMEDGVAKMRPLDAIEIAPGETAPLEPGGDHIMLLGLKGPLVEGHKLALTLTFEKAGAIDIELTIEAAGAGAHADDHSEHQTEE
ncbi:MAG: copper chaperone PCu(A)C [Rhodospirillaceae bacterium]|nr:copper chaperone PCu(A)C [Rhodospirillaceae bacterium]